MIGRSINNYIIERKLGDGGMGEVYYAKHTKVEREVAIKVLHSHLFSNTSLYNRFKNEANALIKLNHPNIVKIFDYIEQENFACLIMEYINGYTLDDYISKITGPLPFKKALLVINSVLDGVQYAHENNIFHRDIKPANIMISKDGKKVRIMDFGIAKLTDSSGFKTTHANTQLGTPFYMSPEQIKGLPFSIRSDIYSLGVTLFEMVTGKCPYHDITSLFDLQTKIVNEPLPPTNKYYPDVSPLMQSAILIATQKDPNNRFQNCKDFKKYLQIDEPESLAIQSKKSIIINEPAKRNNWLIYTFIILTVTISSLLIFNLNRGSYSRKSENFPLKKAVELSTINDSILALKNERIADSLKQEIKNQNKQQLSDYISSQMNATHIDLTQLQINKLYDTILTYQKNISQVELKTICDPYFIPPAPKIKPPSNKRVTEDFWIKIRELKGTFLSSIEYRNDDQIKIDIIQSITEYDKSNPPYTLKYRVRYTISEFDDPYADPEMNTIKLCYIRAGDYYKFSKTE
jgi:serine/threonine protein kinase